MVAVYGMILTPARYTRLPAWPLGTSSRQTVSVFYSGSPHPLVNLLGYHHEKVTIEVSGLHMCMNPYLLTLSHQIIDP
jgi:hypothetical protein